MTRFIRKPFPEKGDSIRWEVFFPLWYTPPRWADENEVRVT
jgi:hypothetical protein